MEQQEVHEGLEYVKKYSTKQMETGSEALNKNLSVQVLQPKRKR
jgi:hypothetical protein